MSRPKWFRAPGVRRALAATAVVLAAGGLVLFRAPQGPDFGRSNAVAVNLPTEGVRFSGPGARGTVALSQTKVLAGGERRIFAEVDLLADTSNAKERAPLSLAVVLDTSGSMAGDKIEQAKRAVIQLIREMRPDDEIAFIRYASDVQVLQPVALVRDVRNTLIERVEAIRAEGGTNIPPALQQGLAALGEARSGRVRRIVLASDGLDGSRGLAETIARDGASRGLTVSTMGIGLDFDQSYMGGVAESGRGNFAFVNDGPSLANFLSRELKETATTTVEAARVRLKLPRGVRFVHATGAEARPSGDGTSVDLELGSLFAGDARRVMVELAASLDAGDVRTISGEAAWSRVGGEAVKARFEGLALSGVDDERTAEVSQDGIVTGNAASVVASRRQIEAAALYDHGDQAAADQLIAKSVAELQAAASAAPSAAPTLLRQASAYEETQRKFRSAPPKSAAGKAAARGAAAQDVGNLARPSF